MRRTPPNPETLLSFLTSEHPSMNGSISSPAPIDRMRWRYGDTNPVVARVPAAAVIHIGDLVWLDGSDRLFAIAEEDCVNAAQRAFVLARFLGVAMQRSPEGEDAPIRVATSGVFEFECREERYRLGELLAPRASQFVGRPLTANQAIGRVARFEETPTPRVLVDVHSAVMAGPIVS